MANVYNSYHDQLRKIAGINMSVYPSAYTRATPKKAMPKPPPERLIGDGTMSKQLQKMIEDQIVGQLSGHGGHGASITGNSMSVANGGTGSSGSSTVQAKAEVKAKAVEATKEIDALYKLAGIPLPDKAVMPSNIKSIDQLMGDFSKQWNTKI